MTTEITDILQGTLERLILHAAARGPVHGYAVSERRRRISNTR